MFNLEAPSVFFFCIQYSFKTIALTVEEMKHVRPLPDKAVLHEGIGHTDVKQGVLLREIFWSALTEGNKKDNTQNRNLNLDIAMSTWACQPAWPQLLLHCWNCGSSHSISTEDPYSALCFDQAWPCAQDEAPKMESLAVEHNNQKNVWYLHKVRFTQKNKLQNECKKEQWLDKSNSHLEQFVCKICLYQPIKQSNVEKFVCWTLSQFQHLFKLKWNKVIQSCDFRLLDTKNISTLNLCLTYKYKCPVNKWLLQDHCCSYSHYF